MTCAGFLCARARTGRSRVRCGCRGSVEAGRDEGWALEVCAAGSGDEEEMRVERRRLRTLGVVGWEDGEGGLYDGEERGWRAQAEDALCGGCPAEVA